MAESAIDYLAPNYAEVYEGRQAMLARMRNPKTGAQMIKGMKLHYRECPWDFISDWGMTFDPRNIARGIAAEVPFVLWPRQVEFLKWLKARWLAGERGLVEKSRDCGVTWLCVGYAATHWCFTQGFSFGFGSRKEDLIDHRGDFDSIFEKLRYFLNQVPIEFRPSSYPSPHMRVINPDNGATIIGEAGDEIGRGGRSAMYIVDEAAFIERQGRVDAALSQNTNCQIDVSTPNGNGNQFYRKRMRMGNTEQLFVFDWRDDPRKDQVWYDKQVADNDEVIIAQEIDRDYDASSEDSFIPAKWVKASLDAHIVLGFEGEGIRTVGFDPADTGDAKALIRRHGSVIYGADQRKKGDITDALPWAFELADQARADVMMYDGDGMGAPAMKVYLMRRAPGAMRVLAYHGSAGVMNPDKTIDQPLDGKRPKRKPPRTRNKHKAMQDGIELKTNADTFVNYRAQTWTLARERFRRTYEAIERAKSGKLVTVRPEKLISISSQCVNKIELMAELSRPKRKFNDNGKIQVESKKAMLKREVESPNLADGAIMAFSPVPPKRVQKKSNYIPHQISDPGVGY